MNGILEFGRSHRSTLLVLSELYVVVSAIGLLASEDFVALRALAQ